MLDKKYDIWHLVAGAVMLALGVLIWANPASALLAAAFYLGLVLFLLGCGYVAFSLGVYSARYMMLGLFDVFVGLIFMSHLSLTAETLPVFFALWILASSVIQLSGSWEVRKLGLPWGWTFAGGIAGVILAYFILTSPAFGDWMLVLTLGAYAVAYGIISIVEYYCLRRCRKIIGDEK